MPTPCGISVEPSIGWWAVPACGARAATQSSEAQRSAERPLRRAGGAVDVLLEHGARLEVVGNLVADAVELAEPAEKDGQPHILMLGGSRDAFAVHVIPFLLALADALHVHLPNARFVWPVSRLLSPEAIAQGIAGVHKDTLGGISGTRDGDVVTTPGGARRPADPLQAGTRDVPQPVVEAVRELTGPSLLSPVLDQCDEKRLPAYLESSNVRNVPFFERHGFVAGSPLDVPVGAPVVVPMRREPR